MKKTNLTLLLIAVLFSACSRYQINVVQSNSLKKDETTGRFIQENDSVRITYSFAGDNAPVAVEIYNKSDKPLIVDWKKSAVIVDDKSISYVPAEMAIKGELRTDVYLNRTLGQQPWQLTGTAKPPVESSFVAPRSSVTGAPLKVAEHLAGRFENVATTKETVPNKLLPTMATKLNTATFTEANSPLKFSSYLTIRTADEQPKTMVFEPRFYVGKYVTTTTEPIGIDELGAHRGDVFTVK